MSVTSSQDSAVVRRKQRDADAHLRRGSLKSRIFQFKKNRRKNGKDSTDDASMNGAKEHIDLTKNGQDQRSLVLRHYDKEPARQRNPDAVLSLRDKTPPLSSPEDPQQSTQPIYAKPVKKQFRIHQPDEERIEPYPKVAPSENGRKFFEPLKISPHAKDYHHEIRRPLGLSIPAPNSPTKPSSRFSQATDLSYPSSCSIPSSPRNQECTIIIQ